MQLWLRAPQAARRGRISPLANTVRIDLLGRLAFEQVNLSSIAGEGLP